MSKLFYSTTVLITLCAGIKSLMGVLYFESCFSFLYCAEYVAHLSNNMMLRCVANLLDWNCHIWLARRAAACCLYLKHAV